MSLIFPLNDVKQIKSKADALRTEAQLLDTFDYAWNKGCNGDRRPYDILRKLEKVTSGAAQFSTIFRKLLPFSQKQVGIKIEATKLISSEKISNGDANNRTYPFFSQVFKVSRSQPRLVFDRPCADDKNTRTCGVAFSDGSVCTRPPVEGRKRCPEHKGKKISSSGIKLNIEVKPQAESEFSMPSEGELDSNGKQFLGFEPTKFPLVVDLPIRKVFTPTCGFSPEDGSPCRRPPVQGRKRCDEHKGKRVYESNNKKMPERTSHYSALDSDTLSEMQTPVSSAKNAVLKSYDATCGVTFGDGSFCSRPPVKGRKRCEEHKGLRINGIISKLVSENKIR
ncbi:putative Effector of transcription2 [Tripterygium wilfordii]|uniref:Putative Effector of transcription2 n=1 Tax=Tripterygium wilfordii TaxID=458696 RepID=A0A7J7BVX9_TRIWF|nr:putative Effector of transcription2 [Tripterygium wilfordii]